MSLKKWFDEKWVDLGTFDTKEQAVKREKQINFFKHLDKRKKK
jgi:hypothetical protein